MFDSPALALLPVAFVALAASSNADVLVVPPPLDPELNVIAEAIAKAAPGDTVQLLEGVYPISNVFDQLLIDKPLRLLGAGPGLTRVEFSSLFSFVLGPNEVEVRDIPAGQEVLIQGITLLAGGTEKLPGAVFVHDCEGVVSLLDCELVNSAQTGSVLRVERCAAFHAQSVESTANASWDFTDSIGLLEDCTVDGVDGPLEELFLIAATPGMRVDRSGLLISSSRISGGRGGAFGLASGVDAPGRPGIVLQSSSLTLFGGSDVAGGDGGAFYGTGARGGPAISADEFSRLSFDPSIALAGGTGASGVVPALKAQPGTQVVEQGRLELHLSSPDPVVANGATTDLLLAGEPGTPIAVYAALAPLASPVPLPGIEGLVGLDLVQAIEVFEGFPLALGVNGELLIQSTFFAGPLETSFEYGWQAVEFLPSGVARVSNPLLTLIEPL